MNWILRYDQVDGVDTPTAAAARAHLRAFRREEVHGKDLKPGDIILSAHGVWFAVARIEINDKRIVGRDLKGNATEWHVRIFAANRTEVAGTTGTVYRRKMSPADALALIAEARTLQGVQVVECPTESHIIDSPAPRPAT